MNAPKADARPRKKREREPKEGLAVMRAPDGAATAGVEGAVYRVDDDGLVEVAHEHVAPLAAAGFERVR